MIDFRFMAKEARDEFVTGLKEPMVPLVAAGLVGYMAIVLLNADYMREMGAANIFRNSPHVVYLMTAGQGFWLFFAWAWLYSRVVSRDRDALLHEIVLSTPRSVRQLMVGRFVGAAALASLLGLVSPLGFLIVHPLDALGAFPAGSLGPAPWGAMAWAWLVFAIPSAVGMGALYVAAAFRTRSSAGPFAVAGAAIALWMVAMVVVRSGEMDPAIATLLDPTAYAEAEEQSNAWTPKEKMTSYFAITVPFVVNRLVWSGLPLVVFALAIARLTRGSLILGTERKTQITATPEAKAGRTRIARPPKTQPSWWRATLSESRWHLWQSLGSRGAMLAIGLFFIMGVAGSFVHVVAHGEGPLIPRPELVMLKLADFSYIIVIFMVAGFVGGLMRRDDRLGFVEMIGAAPAPLSVRVLGRAVAAAGVTVVFACVPLLSALVVTALNAPSSFSLSSPALYFLGVYTPALLEVCTVAVLLHALFRSSGAAHGLTMLTAFIMVINHEINLVTYPPAQIGIPAHMAVSELAGWGPWMASVGTLALLKLSVLGLGIGLAWLAWQRDLNELVRDRWITAVLRLRSGAGLVLASSLVVIFAAESLLNRKVVDLGEYRTHAQAIENDAGWEKRFAPSTFDVTGGDVSVRLQPALRSATVTWSIGGVRSPDALLQGELPSGARLLECDVQGQRCEPEVAHDHFSVELGPCATTGCDLMLSFVVEEHGWPSPSVEDRHKTAPPKLFASQVWMTSSDLLPTLGLDPQREVRSPAERSTHGLPADRREIPTPAAVSSVGVAPAGSWSVAVECPDGWCLETPKDIAGPLDFAVAWLATPPQKTEREGVVAWHGTTHGATAGEILEDVNTIVETLATMSSMGPSPVETVMQVPRGGSFGLHGHVLWLPEDFGWDVTSGGVGQRLRRFTIAREIAATELAKATELRREPGYRLLTDGVAGWLALEVVRALEGDDAWRMLVEHQADRVVEAFGALDAPVLGLIEDGHAPWVEAYSPLSLVAWAEGIGRQEAREQIDCLIDTMRGDVRLPRAAETCLGRESAVALLGTPRSSDASLDATPDGVRVVGERWRWSDNDWQSVAPADELSRLGRDERVQVSTTLEPTEALTVVDPWPSFERSIADNVWPRGESKGE